MVSEQTGARIATSSLTLVTVHILASLSHGPMHGYGIKLDIEKRTDGAMCLGSGTLYQALKRLERQGLVGFVEVDKPGGDNRRGRHYVLRDMGREVLDRELTLMRRIFSWVEGSPDGTQASVVDDVSVEGSLNSGLEPEDSTGDRPAPTAMTLAGLMSR